MTTQDKQVERTQHAPGPWRIDGDYETVVFAQGRDIAICSVHIAITDGVSIDQAKADARLIAAAPETAAERDRLREINAELLAMLWALVEAKTLEQILHRAAQELEALLPGSPYTRYGKGAAEEIIKDAIIDASEAELSALQASHDELLEAAKSSLNLQTFAKSVTTGRADRELLKMEKELERITRLAIKKAEAIKKE